jgi:hypothetical protein
VDEASGNALEFRDLADGVALGPQAHYEGSIQADWPTPETLSFGASVSQSCANTLRDQRPL